MVPGSRVSNLADDLHAALTAARKSQDKDRTLLLGTVLAALKNREIEQNRAPTDEDVVEVLRKGVKTRRESVEQYVKARSGRPGRRRSAPRSRSSRSSCRRRRTPRRSAPRSARPSPAGPPTSARSWGASCPQFKGRADGKVINRSSARSSRGMMATEPVGQSDGVQASSDAGTPSPLPGDQVAAALETLEFDAGARRRRRPAPPVPWAPDAVRARRPTDDLRLDSPGARRRWRSSPRSSAASEPVVVEPVPDATGALARLRVEGSVLDGAELVRMRAAARAPAGSTPRSSAGSPTRRRSPPRSRCRCPTRRSTAGSRLRSTTTASCSTAPVPRSRPRGARCRRRARG